MAVEAKRGCGYRKVGGLYMVSGPLTAGCDRLPIILEVCPCCGQGIKQSRGWTWINPYRLFDGDHYIDGKLCPEDLCPACRPGIAAPQAGLLWVGSKFYSTSSFCNEAAQLGVSKRISAVPRDFVVGETWVFLAHPEATQVMQDEPAEGAMFTELVPVPGVFAVFKPTAIEKIVTETEFQDTEAMDALRKRGITPVPVPDNDPDHANGNGGSNGNDTE